MVNYKNIEHGFKYSCYDLVSLFLNVECLKDFKNRLELQAESNPSKIKREDYLGDGFEFFIELLLKSFPFDKRLGIDGTEYVPIKKSKDMGVDGYSNNLEGLECAVQVKYRTSPKYVLSRKEDDLSSMIEEANHRKIGYAEEGCVSRHFVITTGLGMHHKTENDKYRNKVKCINNNQLQKIVDNNKAFWKNCLKVSKKLMADR